MLTLRDKIFALLAITALLLCIQWPPFTSPAPAIVLVVFLVAVSFAIAFVVDICWSAHLANREHAPVERFTEERRIYSSIRSRW